ncbi:F0F1 ATP synthase subunit delta [Domibacillus enclensis]|uniref:ATP synthase subunit delta n=1 Tax=Domibacillus enclensis TaxID=1017273 RepID=A0A1N6RB21_9BACI|nr:F0F1 ATP synthase subunit delta [Domibacillus enclensis]OXS79002.1 F0F1 ATP synthase subunit delta [Domibacillus enclensis]SIQ26023.1 ATP synthase F1 subcomplex delta subunit [Domibacillus enclensis]
MSKSGAAKRYAIALFELAKEQKQVVEIEQELRVVKQVFGESKELLTVLEAPKLSAEQKQAMIVSAFGQASAPVVNTLKLLVQRHRTNEIPAVCDEYITLANEERGTADAIVYSVRPLSPIEETAVSQAFSRKVGKQTLNIENIVDPNLLGGLKVRIGNRIFDGTLRGKLNRLEKKLTTNL